MKERKKQANIWNCTDVQCTNRLDSSAVVVPGNLRDRGKQTKKKKKKRTPAACSGAPARWGNQHLASSA